MHTEPEPLARDATSEEGALSDPLMRMVHALTELLEKRLDLLELDVRAAASRLAQGSSFLLVGLLFSAVAWVSLMGLIFILLRASFSPTMGVAAVLAINAVLAGITLSAARGRLSLAQRSTKEEPS